MKLTWLIKSAVSVRPQIAILTSIWESHLQNFTTLKTFMISLLFVVVVFSDGSFTLVNILLRKHF